MKSLARSKHPQGFTLIEILLGTALLSMMFAIAFVSATNLSKRLFITPADSFLVHVLTSASRRARDGVQSTGWGVYLPYDETSRTLSEVILFTGPSYALRTPSLDQHLSFSQNVQFVAVDFSGSAAARINDHEVVFSRLSGETTQYGTVELNILGVTRFVSVSSQGFVTREL